MLDNYSKIQRILPNVADNSISKYEFEIFVRKPKIEKSNIYLYGAVKNSCDWDWDGNISVGIRRFFDVNGDVLQTSFEARAKMAAPFVPKGEEAVFSLILPLGQLPPGTASCELDVVNEHVFWLSDHGAKPVPFHLNSGLDRNCRSAWLTLLYRCQTMPTVGPSKFEAIQDVVHHLDFSRYDPIIRIGKLLKAHMQGMPVRMPIPSSATVAASCDRDDLSGGVDTLFHRFALHCGVAPRDLDDPLALARVFGRFVRESRGYFNGGCAPVSQAFSRWLNQRALPHDLVDTPMTRSMIAALERDQNIILNASDNGAATAWWFATCVLVDGKLSRSLVPDLVTQHLARSPKNYDSPLSFPEPTPFMRRLCVDSESYRERYDLDTDGGRIGFSFDLMLLGLDNEVYFTLLGSSILEWMLTPVDQSLGLSPFEIILFANLGGVKPPNNKSGDTHQELLPEARVLRRYYDFLPREGVSIPSPSVRVLGEAKSETGLGVNLRMSVNALLAGGITTEVLDVEGSLLHPPITPPGSIQLARPVDLFHLNADAIPGLVTRYSDWQRADVYRIGFALWEASVMPKEHRAGVSLLNEIWAPTTYVADIYRNAGCENVHIIGKGIDLPQPDPFDLRRIGVEPGDFTFMMSFDVNSWVERKNPIAAIEAFRLAFPHDTRTKMIVKVSGLRDHPGDRTRQIARILSLAERDDRILLINEHFSFASYLGLIAAANAIVSPHRSEGFGYVPAYSLLLGTPALVTNYSGPIDFCTEETSFPISYDLVDIAPGDFVYDTPGAQWADINVSALAETMKQVRDNPEAANLRAAKGGALLRETCSPNAMASRYMERLRAVA